MPDSSTSAATFRCGARSCPPRLRRELRVAAQHDVLADGAGEHLERFREVAGSPNATAMIGEPSAVWTTPSVSL
jgi:hypothetical protein